MKQILPALFLFLFVNIFPGLALASPVISISSPPASVVAGEEFEISFSVSGLGVGSQYFMKALGGTTFSEVDTWNSSWLQQNADWTSMPSFTSDSGGNAQTSLKARFDSATAAGSKEFKIRIRKTDNTTNYDSPVTNISVSVTTPTPSPTSDPTTTPTQTTAPTPTPTPTISKAVHKINKPKDQGGTYLTGVKINIDSNYTHHEDDETLEFCPNCFCDADKQVPCGFGIHTITLTKTGYVAWSEQRNFSQGNIYEVSPVLTIIPTSPTGTPTNSPTPSQTPTLIKASTPTPTQNVILTNAGIHKNSPSPSDISTPSSILGTSTSSSILHSSPSSSKTQEPITNNSLPLKYTFIFGILLSAGSGGWLYFRHKKD